MLNEEPKLCTTSGEPVEKVRAEQVEQTGQHKSYIVLCPEERAKGFVRPVRTSYRHVGSRPKYPLRYLSEAERKDRGYVAFEAYPESESPVTGKYWTEADLKSGCGAVTTMGQSLAETYARDPSFYGATFCATCQRHFPVGASGQFVWLDGSRVGT